MATGDLQPGSRRWVGRGQSHGGRRRGRWNPCCCWRSIVCRPRACDSAGGGRRAIVSAHVPRACWIVGCAVAGEVLCVAFCGKLPPYRTGGATEWAGPLAALQRANKRPVAKKLSASVGD